MVIRFMSKGWSRRPSVPVEYYSVLLGKALYLAANYRGVDELSDEIASELGIVDDSSWTQEGATTFMFRVMEQQNELRGSLDRLEEIKPAPKELLDFHVRAIGFLRGVLTYKDRELSGLMAVMQGKERDARKLAKDADGWQRAMQDAHKEYALELQKVRVKEPALYAALRLHPDVLDSLGLR